MSMHYLPRIKTVIVLLSWAVIIFPSLAFSTATNDRLLDESNDDFEKTVEHSQPDPDKTIEIPESITPLELEQDLNNPTTVRYQLQHNLQKSSLYATLNNDVLREPIACVGTGRDEKAVKLRHVTITLVRDLDTCIDCKREIGPDILLGDAFFIRHELDHIPNNSHGAVFFAHVSNQFLPLNNKESLLKSLSLYHDLLIQGGIFVFNSEVHQNPTQILNHFIKLYNFNDFNELKKSVCELFHDAGFIDVDFLTKEEPEIYADDACSLLVVARKPH